MKIAVSSLIHESPRVQQVRGLFDLAEAKTTSLEWDVHLPLDEKTWQIGLISGPSGCGKSTIARFLWPEALQARVEWPSDSALVDAFPEGCSTQEITEILSSVGFSSPPAWLRPFHVLSVGQQFRAGLARVIAEAVHAPTGRPIVCDEYTSVVDRTVARIGSAAIAKTVRARQLQFVAVTCHDDVEEWLNPDWVYRPAQNTFTWRLLRRRPSIELRIVRCKASAWPLFAPHHYLSGSLLKSAICFLATWHERPVAFSAWASFFGKGLPARREHRTVVLPDFQGVGIGNVVSATIASLWKARGIRALSSTTHPAMIRSRCCSPLWRMTRRPSLARGRDILKHASTRLTAGFEYVGPALSPLIAKALLG